MLQLRPAPGREGDRRFYSPQRDIAHLGTHLVRIAMCGLDDLLDQEPWFREFLDFYGVGASELGVGAQRLAQALGVMDRNTKEALEVSGFAEVPAGVQAAMYIKMGQVLLAAIHAGIRDVTRAGDGPPNDVAELALIAEEAASQLRCQYGDRADPGSD